MQFKKIKGQNTTWNLDFGSCFPAAGNLNHGTLEHCNTETFQPIRVDLPNVIFSDNRIFEQSKSAW
jgi:hypothetical protein